MHTQHVELRHLRYFVAAAEAENVSRAALKLHVSQPALSRQIKDLEEELRFPLFERSARSVRLTEAGRTFLDHARAVLQRTEEAVQAARSVAAGQSGELHIGYAPSPSVKLLPPILRAFQKAMPNIRVRLHDLSTREMLAGLRSGNLKAAVMVRPGRAMLRRLQFEDLAEEPWCLAVPPDHPLARKKAVTLEEAVQEPLVEFNRKEYPEYADYLVKLFEPIGRKPHILEDHDSAASLIAAIESGAGLAMLPQSFSCSAGARLKLLPIVPEPQPLVVGIAWSDQNATAASESFLRAARAAGRRVIDNDPQSSG